MAARRARDDPRGPVIDGRGEVPGGASLGLAGLAIAVFLAPSAALDLEYDRAAVAAGEVWRLVTCHWTHWSLGHLFWDVVVFGALLAGGREVGRARVIGCLVAASIAIPVSLWHLQPGIVYYRRLSGLDSTLAALEAVWVLREASASNAVRLAGSVVLAALVGKITVELMTGSSLFVDARALGVVAGPLAHIVGAAVGILFGVVRWNDG